MGKKVLWVSRHTPLTKQVEALKEHCGDDYELVLYPAPFDSAEDIVKIYQQGNYEDIVVVAPLSVISRMIMLGVKPLWAEMRRAEAWEKPDVLLKGKRLMFDRYRRITNITVKFEELE